MRQYIVPTTIIALLLVIACSGWVFSAGPTGGNPYAEIVVIDANVDAILADTIKIDEAATSGLSGTNNSLAYRVHEIERHFHSYESWFETAATPSGTTNTADRIGSGGGAWSLDAGNDTWGTWVQILGSEDTPARTSQVKYDFHEILVEGTERSETYFIQIAFGAVDAATAFSAGDYTEIAFHAVSNQIDAAPVVVQSRRQSAGVMCWARVMCPGQNTATIDIYVGLHEYEG